MARKSITPLDLMRKAAARYSRDVLKTRRKIKRSEKKKQQKESDKDYIAKWRALNRIGAVTTKNRPAAKYLTPRNKRTIRAAFSQVQNFAAFREGTVQRPFVRTIFTTTKTWRDDSGKIIRRREYTRRHYDLNSYFHFVRTKEKIDLSGILKTRKGYLIPKTGKGSRIVIRDGKLTEYNELKAGKVKITREGLSGPEEILALRDAIRDKKIKLKKGEGLRVISNGSQKRAHGFLYDDLDSLAKFITDYEEKYGPQGFADWANRAEIIMFSIR